ncbi:unnamed protein product [Meloidogyne enterolobii]|uniref:Uncharacterized protein n=1 Tax=Meloidogyne enterolobii TaxID=390850 RepID=A0ACB0YHI9_MELEN
MYTHKALKTLKTTTIPPPSFFPFTNNRAKCPLERSFSFIFFNPATFPSCFDVFVIFKLRNIILFYPIKRGFTTTEKSRVGNGYGDGCK